jgi:hypothetical protein
VTVPPLYLHPADCGCGCSGRPVSWPRPAAAEPAPSAKDASWGMPKNHPRPGALPPEYDDRIERQKRDEDGPDAIFGAGVAALVGRAAGIEVDEVVEVKSFSRYYDHVIVNGEVVKTGHQESTTKRTLWRRPK